MATTERRQDIAIEMALPLTTTNDIRSISHVRFYVGVAVLEIVNYGCHLL